MSYDDTTVELGHDFLPAYLMGVAQYIAGTLDGSPRNLISDRKRTPLDVLAAFGIGACAELAVCKYIGADWNSNVLRLRASVPPDIVHNGITYEVRDTAHLNGNLIVYPRRDRRDVDAWVLVIVEPLFTQPWRFRMAGWATRADADELGNSYGERSASLWIQQHMLRPLPRGGLTRDDIAFANGRKS